jgi:hypothetical protein
MLIFYRWRARRHKGVIALAQAPRNRQRITGDPTRLVRRQEHRDRRYIVRLSGSPKRRLRDKLLLEIAADVAHGTCTLSIGKAWIDRVDPNFARTQLLRQHAGHRVDRAFRPAPMPFDAPVTTAILPDNLLMTFHPSIFTTLR